MISCMHALDDDDDGAGDGDDDAGMCFRLLLPGWCTLIQSVVAHWLCVVL